MEDELATNEKGTESTQPIIIDLGKQRRKRIKRLKKGRGKLWRDVMDVIDEVGDQIGDETEGKTIVPVILIYRRKPRRWGRGRLPGF